jgi:undecaprenyl-diphosphatase
MRKGKKAGLTLLLGILILPLPLLVPAFVAWDQDLFLTLFRYHPSSWSTVIAMVTDLGSMVLWALVVVALWIFRKRNLATYLLVTLAIALTVYMTMKYAVDRPRPFDVFPIDPLYRPFDPSYPSGHAMTAFAAAGIIGAKEKRLLLPLLALACLVGFSRVYIGVHFPYDVLSGALLGLLVAYFVSCLDLTPLQRWIGRGLCRLGLRRECSE